MLGNAYSPGRVFSAHTANGETLILARVLHDYCRTVKDAFCVRSDDGAFIYFNPRRIGALLPTFVTDDDERNSPSVVLMEAIEDAYSTRAEFFEAVSAIGEPMPADQSQ